MKFHEGQSVRLLKDLGPDYKASGIYTISEIRKNGRGIVIVSGSLSMLVYSHEIAPIEQESQKEKPVFRNGDLVVLKKNLGRKFLEGTVGEFYNVSYTTPSRFLGRFFLPDDNDWAPVCPGEIEHASKYPNVQRIEIFGLNRNQDAVIIRVTSDKGTTRHEIAASHHQDQRVVEALKEHRNQVNK